VWVQSEPVYQSETTLRINYIVAQPGWRGDYESRQESCRGGDQLIDAEIAVLTSRDLALRVAEEIGPELLALDGSQGKGAILPAADVIRSGLEVEKIQGSPVFTVRFRCAEPVLAKDVLKALINAYIEKHMEVYLLPRNDVRASQQVDQARSEMRQIEDELRKSQKDPETDELTLKSLKERYEEASEALRKAEEAVERTRLDDGLAPPRTPNITHIQRPTNAVRVRSEGTTTLAIILAIAGPVLGALFSLVPMGRRPQPESA
jgi:uncharacterized protein involved in exopolysaccharide biosynthesis